MSGKAILRVVAAALMLVVGLMVTSPADGASSITMVITARGQTGEEVMRVRSESGETFYEQTLTTGFTDYAVSIPTALDVVYVAFVNDGRTPGGADRNMLVDRIRWDGGIVVEAEDVLSKGVWNGADCKEGFRNSEFLACNGWFKFEVPPPIGGDNRIAVAARGTTGAEVVELEVNGETIASYNLSTTLNVYDATYAGVINKARIHFVNDRFDENGDRNVYVEYLEANGGTFDPTDARSQGVWNGTDCGVGYRQSRTLHCNGWFEFVFDGGGGGGDGGGGGGTDNGSVVVKIQGTTGTEEVRVLVNGLDIGGISVPPFPVPIDMPLPDGDIDSIRVQFTNDGVDGEGRDRNVILHGISAMGVDYGPNDFFGKGVWDGNRCDVEAYHNTDFLACNGWFEVHPGGGGNTVDIRGFTSYGCRLHTGPEADGVADQLAHYNWSDYSTGEIDYVAFTELTGTGEPGGIYHLGPDAETIGLVTDTAELERVDQIHVLGPAGEEVTVQLTGACPDERGWGDAASVIAGRAVDGTVQVLWNPVVLAPGNGSYRTTLLDGEGQSMATNLSEPVSDPDGAVYGRTTFAEPVPGGTYGVVVETCADFAGDGCTGDEWMILHRTYEFHVLGAAETDRTAPVDVAGSRRAGVEPGIFTVTWTDPAAAEAAQRYEVVVEREDAPGNVVSWFSIDGPVSQAEVGIRPRPGNHRFAVRACTGSGCGAWSEWSDWVNQPGFG